MQGSPLAMAIGLAILLTPTLGLVLVGTVWHNVALRRARQANLDRRRRAERELARWTS